MSGPGLKIGWLQKRDALDGLRGVPSNKLIMTVLLRSLALKRGTDLLTVITSIKTRVKAKISPENVNDATTKHMAASEDTRLRTLAVNPKVTAASMPTFLQIMGFPSDTKVTLTLSVELPPKNIAMGQKNVSSSFSFSLNGDVELPDD